MTEQKFEDYIQINKMYLTLLGLWPLSDKDSSWRNCINKFHAVTIIILLLTLLIPPMILDLYFVWGNITAIVQNLCLTVHGIFISLKFIHVISNKRIFQELLRIMENNFDNGLLDSTSKDQKIILLEHANFARTVTKYFLVSVYYFETLLFLVPFIYGIDTDPVRHKRYPYCSWYYYDQYSNAIYALCYGIQAFIGICLGVSFLAGMDSFIFVAIWHSCAHLSILQMKLLRLGDASSVSSKTIEDIVDSHNSQIRLVHIQNQLFSKLCLYQFLTSGFVICFSGFQLIVSLSSGDSDYRGTVLYFGYLVVNLFQILLYCWPSNVLMEKSFGVGNAAYQSLWTNLRHNSSKAVILMILRAQNPLVISAGGMYDMTLQNFTGIVKASMSFLSLLRAMMSSH